MGFKYVTKKAVPEGPNVYRTKSAKNLKLQRSETFGFAEAALRSSGAKELTSGELSINIWPLCGHSSILE